jgi:hypothetical protein
MTPMLLIRPGGWIIVHEPLRFPPPRSHPPLDALGTYWEMLYGVLERAGVPAGTVEDLPAAARAVGLDVASADGFFVLGEPELAFEIHAGDRVRGRRRSARHRGQDHRRPDRQPAGGQGGRLRVGVHPVLHRPGAAQTLNRAMITAGTPTIPRKSDRSTTSRSGKIIFLSRTNRGTRPADQLKPREASRGESDFRLSMAKLWWLWPRFVLLADQARTGACWA